jgi:hypothetical protein
VLEKLLHEGGERRCLRHDKELSAAIQREGYQFAGCYCSFNFLTNIPPIQGYQSKFDLNLS